MACMEVWGGNRPIASAVTMAGVDAWVFSRPYHARPAADAAPTAEPSSSAPSASGGAAAGGDIHYLSSCAAGNITRMVLADVSGHGAAVAAAAASLRRLMGRFSNYIDQSRFVAAVNARFHELHEENDAFAGLFATAITATYYAPTDELTLSNAGHPRPLRYIARDNRWCLLAFDTPADPPDAAGGTTHTPANLPWGVLEDIPYTRHTTHIEEGDVVLFYTDSLIELKNPDGRQIGEQGLLALAASLDPMRPEGLIADLIARAAAYERGGPTDPDAHTFDDDVTLLLIRRNTAKPRPSPLLTLKAAGRIVRTAIASLFDRDVAISLPDHSGIPALDSARPASSQRSHRGR